MKLGVFFALYLKRWCRSEVVFSRTYLFAFERFDLKAYPRGFKMALTDLPGTIEADTE